MLLDSGLRSLTRDLERDRLMAADNGDSPPRSQKAKFLEQVEVAKGHISKLKEEVEKQVKRLDEWRAQDSRNQAHIYELQIRISIHERYAKLLELALVQRNK